MGTMPTRVSFWAELKLDLLLACNGPSNREIIL
jgi:hypothetical protein